MALNEEVILIVLALVLYSYVSKATMIDSVCYDDAESLYEVEITESLSLGDYRGKVVLVVNTASFCTYTYQYPFINILQDQFGDELAILGFPCNQFGLQEPGVGEEIPNTLRYVRPGGGFQPNFYLNEKKIDVNGPNAHSLFTKLKTSCPPAKRELGDPSRLYWSPMVVGDITWNFNKFLLDKTGVPFKRYDSAVEPKEIVDDIRLILNDGYRTVERPSRPKYYSDEM
nr:glutathione peroxidase 1-like [Lytechinus pictus]